MRRMYKRIWVILAAVIIIALILIAFFTNIPIVANAPAGASSTASSTAGATLPSQLAVHLDIFVHGAPVALPVVATTTANASVPFSIRTTADGLVIFTPALQGATLGQVFDAFGERLTPLCMGAYCASASDTFRIYINGELWQGDPSQIPLVSHDEIAIVYGTASEIPDPVPSSYSFPAED